MEWGDWDERAERIAKRKMTESQGHLKPPPPYQTDTELRAEIARLRAALKWALPLAEQALEQCRQIRNQAGHTDIRAGDIVGLWPEEIAERDKARSALKISNEQLPPKEPPKKIPFFRNTRGIWPIQDEQTALPKVNSEGLRLAAKEGHERVSSVTRVKKDR